MNTRRMKAFTLPELMISLSIMAVIGLAVATVASALSKAYQETNDLEQTVQSGRLAITHLESSIRKGKLVVASSSSHLGLWIGDANGDGAINVDELIHFRHVEDDRTVVSRRIVFPASLPDSVVLALNEKKDLKDLNKISKIDAIISSATLANYRQTNVLATDVQTLILKIDERPPHGRLVSIQMTIGDTDGQQIAFDSCVTMRADAVEDIVRHKRHWVLELDEIKRITTP